MRLKKALAAIFSVLTFSWSCVIWSFSFASAEISGEQSTEVTGLINKLLGFLFEGGLSDAVVRKLAHFAEFAVLGAFVFLMLWAFSLRKLDNRTFLLLIISAFVAGVDEGIQLGSPGRAFRISDILLDISGAVTAFLILELIVFVSKRIKNKKSR